MELSKQGNIRLADGFGGMLLISMVILLQIFVAQIFWMGLQILFHFWRENILKNKTTNIKIKSTIGSPYLEPFFCVFSSLL